jgi:hypothetical protein
MFQPAVLRRNFPESCDWLSKKVGLKADLRMIFYSKRKIAVVKKNKNR